MGDIEFNRAAVGINAKKDWEDADNFGQVGAYIDKLPSTGIALFEFEKPVITTSLSRGMLMLADH